MCVQIDNTKYEIYIYTPYVYTSYCINSLVKIINITHAVLRPQSKTCNKNTAFYEPVATILYRILLYCTVLYATTTRHGENKYN